MLAGLSSALHAAQLALLNAPFVAGGWARAIEAVAVATRSSAAQLLGLGGPLLLPLNVRFGRFGEFTRYLEDPMLHGACNWRVGSAGEPLSIQFEPDYRRYRLTADTADYDDAVSDMDIPFGCQSALLLDSGNLLGLALLRSRRDGPCDDGVLADFAVLRRQAARAVRMQLALDGEAAEVLLGDLSHHRGAVILLDRHGNLCALSEAAEALFEEDGPLRLIGLSVSCRAPAEQRGLQSALARLMGGDETNGPALHQTTVGRRADGLPGWQLVAIRLPGRVDGLGFDPHLALTLRAISPSRGRNQPRENRDE